MYSAGDAVGVASRKSIFGAFMLYGSFVSMFVNILQLLGFMSQE
jgi:FtsH-binding integral membrane protein